MVCRTALVADSLSPLGLAVLGAFLRYQAIGRCSGGAETRTSGLGSKLCETWKDRVETVPEMNKVWEGWWLFLTSLTYPFCFKTFRSGYCCETTEPSDVVDDFRLEAVVAWIVTEGGTHTAIWAKLDQQDENLEHSLLSIHSAQAFLFR